MHMLFRTILHAWISRFGKRVGHYDVVSTKLRVLPTDLDILRHMNNGVYLSIFDIGRFDLIRRSGVWQIFADRGWYPVVASETITFRKSLQLWQKFTVESRIIGFDEKAAYMQHRAVVNGEIYAEAFIKARFLKRAGGTVPVSEILDAVGPTPKDLELPEWLLRWGDDVRLPSTRAEAPSVWE
ncbi:acyl-CoA thioesterase [Humibacter ginsenosidimutans]|uniref:Thioesterase n=1 Tax=Humibacter ginsenosidimutans TaxID=2599293 RepID=A0A5B8M8D3_9MICO|nr:thioesterase family protein [Humibacter ginsenosidimutans]QDZ15680.1 thioesterase [Humibacter ginsenosidimutans]